MESYIDIQKYFERIGFNQNAYPDFETLRQLNFLHSTTIPFENIDPLLKIPVNIDTESIQKKLVNELRGGYCFEQNLLFFHALKHIGFEVTLLAARVLWRLPENIITQRTHTLLLITFNDKKYLSDVGFGGQTFTGPIEFEIDKEQETPLEPYRIKKIEGDFLMQVKINNEWESIYRFSLQPQYLVDYEVANWFTSTNPNHIFTKVLTVSLAGSDRRFTLYNNKFNTHYVRGKTETRILENANEIKEVLTNTFKIKLPLNERLDEVLSSLINSNQKKKMV